MKIDDLAPLLALNVALVVLFCFGAFHRVHEKIMQHFHQLHQPFPVLPSQEVHWHSNMRCISGASPPEPQICLFHMYALKLQVLQVCLANKSKDLFPNFAAFHSWIQENLLPSVALALWTSFSWRRDHISSRGPWESRRWLFFSVDQGYARRDGGRGWKREELWCGASSCLDQQAKNIWNTVSTQWGALTMNGLTLTRQEVWPKMSNGKDIFIWYQQIGNSCRWPILFGILPCSQSWTW